MTSAVNSAAPSKTPITEPKASWVTLSGLATVGVRVLIVGTGAFVVGTIVIGCLVGCLVGATVGNAVVGGLVGAMVGGSM